MMKHSFKINYFFNCKDPPIFSSFSMAAFEAKSASMLTFSLISPVPKIFNFVEFLRGTK